MLQKISHRMNAAHKREPKNGEFWENQAEAEAWLFRQLT